MDKWSNNDQVFDHQSMGGWNAGNETMGFDLAKGWDNILTSAGDALEKVQRDAGTKVESAFTGGISSLLDKQLANLLGTGGGVPTVTQGPGGTNIVQVGDPNQALNLPKVIWYKDPLNLAMIGGGVLMLSLVLIIALKKS